QKSFMHTLNNLFQSILRKIFLFLDILIPKNKKFLIFTTRGGGLFYDNSKYLFLSFLKHYNTQFKIFWYCSNKNIYNSLLTKIDSENLLYQYSLRGIWTILRAKTIFFTHGIIRDFDKLYKKKRCLILLWHAVNFKNKSLTDPQKSSKEKKYLPKKFSTYTFIIASSEKDKENISLCTGIDPKKIKIVGLPRHDFLFNITPSTNRTDRKIIYAPTFRKTTKTIFFPFPDINIPLLKSFLKDYNIKIYLRPHYHYNKYPFYIPVDILQHISENISFLDWTKYEDTTELLPDIDILITDYSSIFIDFLILDRPIIFIPYDREDYEKERGLLYNYDEITPGPKIKTQKEFLYWLEQFVKNPELFKDERTKIKENFFAFYDGKSYERIYTELKKLNL
ncbi:MAG: CDP-glycerol glycerophosphotransferase family protein, partial [Candidatus Omnitrophica bacterium]|nr:CDP-glycerol glycerophosphotransferase family protein [Candidatus Omnitrophota bacterium]